MNKQISIKKIRYDAEEIFRQGGFYCSEAIVSTIRKHIAPEMPISYVAAASGFPIGVGRAKCMCGAVSGAVIVLGYFFGRTDPSSIVDPKSVKCMELAHEIQAAFRKRHKGTLCCHIHVKGMDLTLGEHKTQCVMFTGDMAEDVAKIIARELNLEVID